MSKNNAISRIKDRINTDELAREGAINITRDLLYLVQSSVDRSSSPKLAKAVAIGSAAYTIVKLIKQAHLLYKQGTADEVFEIKIKEGDISFGVVETWIAAKESGKLAAPTISIRSTIDTETLSERRARVSMGLPEDPDKPRKVIVTPTAANDVWTTLDIEGHTVSVFIKTPEITLSNAAERVNSGMSSGFRSMLVICPSLEAREAVLAKLTKDSQSALNNRPQMYLSSKYGDWNSRSDIPPRSQKSVILKEGQMGRIMDHLDTFRANKSAYEKADIPYRTGIMLHGEPGSGKSSTALAIANSLGMPVHIITLSSLDNDDALNDLFMSIPKNSVVILEDIDVASSVRERDADGEIKGVTMSGMLNVLDGFQSPPGVITIMTTNRLDVIDKAIVRPGRVDLVENLSNVDDYQLRGLCEYLMGTVPDNLPRVTPEDGISSAAIMGVVRKHLPDFENAAEDLVAFISEKTLTSVAA